LQALPVQKKQQQLLDAVEPNSALEHCDDVPGKSIYAIWQGAVV